MKDLGYSMLTRPCHFLRVVGGMSQATMPDVFQPLLEGHAALPTQTCPPSRAPFFNIRPSKHPAFFAWSFTVFLVWAGLRIKSILPLPVSCFALTRDDCSVLWVTSLGPTPLQDRKPS